MPFQVLKRGDKYVVVTKGSKKVHGTFDSKEKAMAQLRALYANVPEARE